MAEILTEILCSRPGRVGPRDRSALIRRFIPIAQIHAKGVLRDVRGTVPAEAPMMILDDEIRISWAEEEAEALREMGGFEVRRDAISALHLG